MTMKKYKLGELVELTDERNSMGRYSLEDVKGISTEKNFIETKANMDGVSLDSYKVVNYGEFAYVPDTSRRGDKIALAFNSDSNSILISSIYTTFKCKRNDVLSPVFLFMFFNRPEFDRYSRFNSWGSARESFSWEALCDMKLTLPSIEQQRKYVDVYLALQNNLAAYQSKVEELKLVCDGYIEELRRKMKCEIIGTYIRECNTRNENLCVLKVQGVESSGNFAETRANTNGIDFHNYKIVKPNQFAYNPSRINLGSIALRNEVDGKCIVSPMYVVFEVIDSEKLMPDYLLLWLSRSEFLRSTLFYASGSVRDTFGFDDMNDVAIPIPDISVQREIVNIHKCYIERQRIAEALKEQLKNICPVLIRGSLNN